MDYRIIDQESYYRKGVFRHFSEDCRCSTSMTARLDVTELAAYSRATHTRFYVNFLYILSKVLNSQTATCWPTYSVCCSRKRTLL